MFLQLADWKLRVDVPLTMLFSGEQAREHCMCGYCKNFYASVDRTYPLLRPFLSQFGIHIEGPDELCPFEPTIYEATYIVQGEIVHMGEQPLYIGEVPLTIQTPEEADLSTEHPLPYFTISVGLLELPWLLDEPMSEVVSPANETEFLDRMERKLLCRLQNDHFSS